MPKIIKISGTPAAQGNTASSGGSGGVAVGGSSSHALTADRAALADRALTADYATEAALAMEAEDLTEDSPVRDQFAYKDRDDVIAASWQSSGYDPGALGTGWSVGLDADGLSRLVVDRLYVRYKAIFDALEIRRLSQVGGVSILSPAGGTIISVEQAQTYLGSLALRDADGKELLGSDGAALRVIDPASLATVWRCRLRTDDGQQAVSNDFAVGDLVQCRTFNLASGQRFWWRRCVGVGADYIDLSMTDCAAGSDTPLAGDAAATLGNAFNPERQHAISMAAYGPDTPSITLYQGIKTYSTAGCDKTLISPYGSKFTGDFVVVADGSEVPLAQFLADRISLSVRGTQADYSAESGTVESVDKIAVLSLRPEISSLKAGTRLRIAFDIDFNQEDWDGFEAHADGGDSIFITSIEGNTDGWTEQERHYEFDVELTEPVGNGSLLEIDGYPGQHPGTMFRVSGLSVTRIPLERELTETGIDIQSGKITLKGDTEIITNDGSTAALFRDGRIKAEYVEAGEVTADRVETRPASDTSKARTVIEGGRQVYYGDDGDVRLLVHSGPLSPDNADEGGVLVPQLAATMQATERTATETLVSGVQVAAISQLDLSTLSLLAAANFVEGPAPPPDFGDGPYYGSVRLALYDDCGADSTLIAAKTVSIGGTGAFSAAFADFGRVVLQPGAHSLRVEVSLNTALTVSGTWALNAPPAVLPLAGASTATEIAADGAALRAGDSYVKVVGEGTTIKAGNYALRVTEAGIEASNDGGGTWSPIFT